MARAAPSRRARPPGPRGMPLRRHWMRGRPRTTRPGGKPNGLPRPEKPATGGPVGGGERDKEGGGGEGPEGGSTRTDLRAGIARTMGEAGSARNAGTGRTGRAAGTRPGPGGDAAPGSARTAGPGRSADAPAAATPSLLRSSGAMAVGTIASRVTGFVRSAILIYAIGTHDLGNAYNVANTLPNIVYNLALGGILSSVVVPLLVNAAKRSRDRGEAYDQRIFTLGVMALGGITVVATAAAVPIASVYARKIGNAPTSPR